MCKLLEKGRSLFSKSVREIKDIGWNFLPQNKKEVFIALGLFIFYFSYSLFFILNTSIIDLPTAHNNIYFSFDNASIYTSGYENLASHPLLDIYSRPLMYICDVLVEIFGYKSKTLMLVAISSMSISMSVVYMYRYLKNILHLRVYSLGIITLFYSFFQQISYWHLL